MIGKRATIAAASIAVFGLPSLSRADVVVSTAPTANMTCTGGVCSPTARKAVLNVSDLATMLASGDVTIQSGALAQDIDFAAPLKWTTIQRLTLDSYHSIYFQKPVVVAGTGSLTIVTDDGGSGGDFRFSGKGHVEFRVPYNGGDNSLIINGHPYTLVGGMHELTRLTKGGFGQPYLALVKSIDLSGTSYSSSPLRALNSTLEGLGNSISNLTTNNTQGAGSAGLIGTFGGGEEFTLRDLNLTSVNIVAAGVDQPIGALASLSYGAIQNVYVSGSITATGTFAKIGGLAGTQLGPIINAQCDVAITAGSMAQAGGLAGTLDGATNQFAIVVQNSFSTGTITASDNSSVGGLVGVSTGNVIVNSYSTASVAGGANSWVGGAVGMQESTVFDFGLRNVYATGNATAGSGSSVGGLIGSDSAGSSNADAYWDLDTSGVSDPSKGAGNIADDPGLTGLTTAEFQSALPAGFEASVWRESATVNSGYPYLIGNPPK